MGPTPGNGSDPPQPGPARIPPATRLERLRLRLAGFDDLPRLAAVGVVAGFATGGVIAAFRLAVQLPLASFLPGRDAENFEGLDPLVRLLLAVGGGLAVGLLLRLQAPGRRETGVVHVMERLAYHQAYLPLRNALTQFAGAVLCLVSGHSVGREGPSVHLGAATGSLLGRQLGLPNNSVRVLTGCGVAAAIGAAFNTPIAGVIFAMEVVMMEYTLTGFTPVILAAVSSTAVTRLVFGESLAFLTVPLDLGSVLELPAVLIMGVAIGALAAAFIVLLRGVIQATRRIDVTVRCVAAGLATGVCAWLVPEVMGVGYDTVNRALLGELAAGVMLGVLAFKFIATVAAVGLGLPGGLISPTLVLGAAAGGLIGVAANTLFPGAVASHALYALLGMGAMMAATLQAPLAALMAMLELSGNPNIILPGMLAVVSASLVASEVFGQRSVFLMQMSARGLDYRNDPVAQSLRRVSVGRVMDVNFAQAPRELDHDLAEGLLAAGPHWIVVAGEPGKARVLLPAADLARHLAREDTPSGPVNLGEIPASRVTLGAISLRATLQEALDLLDTSDAEALLVEHGAPARALGVITRTAIEARYRYRATPR